MPPEVQSPSVSQRRVVRVSTPISGTHPLAVASHEVPRLRTFTTRQQRGLPSQSWGAWHTPSGELEQEEEIRTASRSTREVTGRLRRGPLPGWDRKARLRCSAGGEPTIL